MRSLTRTALAVYGELAFTAVGSIVSIGLAARDSVAAAAAFGLVTSLVAAAALLVRVVAAGIGVVVATAAGRDDAALHRSAAAGLASCTWLGCIGGLLVVSCLSVAVEALGAPRSVLELAAPLAFCSGLAVMVDAQFAAMGAVLRASGRQWIAMHAAALSGVVQLAGCAWLHSILGLNGLLLSCAFGRAMGVVYGDWALRRSGLALRARDWVLAGWSEVRAIVSIGFPAAIEASWWRACFLFATSVVAGLGEQSLALMAMFAQVQGFVLLAGVSAGLAAEVEVARCMGLADVQGAKNAVWRALWLGQLVTVIGCAVVIAMPKWTLGGLWVDEKGGQDLMVIGGLLLFTETGRCVNLVVINGLRGARDVLFPAAIAVASMTLFLGFGSWLLGSYAQMGLLGVLLAGGVDEWARAGLMAWRLWSGAGGRFAGSIRRAQC